MAISLFFKTKKNFQRGVIKVICDMKKKKKFFRFTNSNVTWMHTLAIGVT